MKSFDTALFRYINDGLAGDFADWFMATATSPHSWTVPILVLCAAMVAVDRKRGIIAIMVALAAVGIGDAFSGQSLKPFFGRIRPCNALQDVHLLVGCTQSFSFPSNHAVNSFAIAGAIGYIFRPLLWILLPVGVTVAVSRIEVGVHYPSDVVAGGVFGFAVGWGMAAMSIKLLPSAFTSAIGKKKAVFLDRDGCVNVEDNHIRDISRFRLYPDSIESIRRLNKAGFLVVVITNQSGVARGYMTEELVNEVHQLLLKWCRDAKVKIDDIRYCPHHPDGAVERYSIKCGCRKPEPGMLLDAAEKLGIDLTRSYVVGDKISDIKLGPATGAKTALVRTGFGAGEEAKIREGKANPPDHIADGIGQAVDWILEDSRLPR